jgi:1,4-dihydroxy-6-naphthoate synthase
MRRVSEPLRIAISPCPNDTFIWAGVALGAIRLPWPVQITYYDIDELNRLAQRGGAHLVKVSFFQYALLPRGSYGLLPVGAALGYGVGPLLIARAALSYEALAAAKIGIPGLETTANSLLHFYAPHAQNRLVYRYDQLIPALLAGEIDAAVIIHELRFTYAKYGLTALQDLGAYWTEKTGLPIPLGGLILRRDLLGWRAFLSAALRKSLRWAYRHPASALAFVGQYADDMDPAVQKAHINLYVNAFSHRLGSLGKRAIATYLRLARAATRLGSTPPA